MRAAPPVRVTVQPPWVARLAVASLAGIAAASATAWIAGHAGFGVFWGVLALPIGAGLGWALGPRVPFSLDWDGQLWWCDGARGDLSVQLDLQALMLLRWRATDGGGVRWLLPHRSGVGAHWHALRVALMAAGRSGRASGADPAGQAPLVP